MTKESSVVFWQIEEERELAVITLQKLIRGRAVQNMVSFVFFSLLVLSNPAARLCVILGGILSLSAPCALCRVCGSCKGLSVAPRSIPQTRFKA